MRPQFQQIVRFGNMFAGSKGFCYLRGSVPGSGLACGAFRLQMLHRRHFSIRKISRKLKHNIRYKEPHGFVLAYQAPAANYAYAACVFVFVGTVCFVPITFVLMLRRNSWVSDYDEDQYLLMRQLVENKLKVYAFIVCISVLLLALHTIVQRYPMRIYYDHASKFFLVYFLKFEPGSVRIFIFDHGEMRAVTGMSAFRAKFIQDKYEVGSQRLILHDEGFRTLRHFNIMLGRLTDEEEFNNIDDDDC